MRSVPPPGSDSRAGPAPALLVGLVAVTGAAVVGAVDPNRPGQYLVCPVLALAGVACPFCGGLRAVHALTGGDLSQALSFNPAVVLALPVAVAVWGVWLARGLRHRSRAVLPTWGVWALLAALVVFGVLRNLPGLRPLLTPWLLP